MTRATTRSDLPHLLRTQIIASLNERLAEGIDLSLQARQAHWNVAADHPELKEVFGRLYTSTCGWIDVMAERAMRLGGVVRGTLEVVAAKSTLPTYRLKRAEGRAHVDALTPSLAAFVSNLRKTAEVAEESGDDGTADLLERISASADKMLWQLEEQIQDS